MVTGTAIGKPPPEDAASHWPGGPGLVLLAILAVLVLMRRR